MNKIKFKEYFLEQNNESLEGYNGPWYHGGTYSGNGSMKISIRGGYGWGIYFTNNKNRAEGYSRETSWGEKHTKETFVNTFYIKYNNPLFISYKETNNHTPHSTDILIKLGLPKEKAINIVDKADEKYGYISKQIYTLATKMGYDCLIVETSNDRELVVWNPYNIKVIKNNI